MIAGQQLNSGYILLITIQDFSKYESDQDNSLANSYCYAYQL